MISSIKAKYVFISRHMAREMTLCRVGCVTWKLENSSHKEKWGHSFHLQDFQNVFLQFKNPFTTLRLSHNILTCFKLSRELFLIHLNIFWFCELLIKCILFIFVSSVVLTIVSKLKSTLKPIVAFPLFTYKNLRILRVYDKKKIVNYIL